MSTKPLFCAYCARFRTTCNADPCPGVKAEPKRKSTAAQRRDKDQERIRWATFKALRDEHTLCDSVVMSGTGSLTVKTNAGNEFTVTIKPKSARRKKPA